MEIYSHPVLPYEAGMYSLCLKIIEFSHQKNNFGNFCTLQYTENIFFGAVRLFLRFSNTVQGREVEKKMSRSSCIMRRYRTERSHSDAIFNEFRESKSQLITYSLRSWSWREY